MSLLTSLIEDKRQKEINLLQEKLRKATKILHTKSEIETLDFALERIIEEFEHTKNISFSEEVDSAFDLNYVKPKRTYEIEAEFEFVGRGKPMPFDFSDIDFEKED